MSGGSKGRSWESAAAIGGVWSLWLVNEPRGTAWGYICAVMVLSWTFTSFLRWWREE
jgi:hypothetical protein